MNEKYPILNELTFIVINIVIDFIEKSRTSYDLVTLINDTSYKIKTELANYGCEAQSCHEVYMEALNFLEDKKNANG